MRWGFITPIYIQGNEVQRFRNQGHSANQWLGLDINPSLSLSKVTAFPPFLPPPKEVSAPFLPWLLFSSYPASVMFLKHVILSSIPRPLHLLSPLLETPSTRLLWNRLLINYVSAQDAICPEQPSLSILSRLALKSLSHIIHHHLIISCLFAYYLHLSI